MNRSSGRGFYPFDFDWTGLDSNMNLLVELFGNQSGLSYDIFGRKGTNMSVPNIRYYFFVSSFLIIPFLLKLKGLEPYPSIIFPEGSSKTFQDKHQITVKRIELLGWNSRQRQFMMVSHSDFLGVIPNVYLPFLYRRDFGLSLMEEVIRGGKPSKLDKGGATNSRPEGTDTFLVHQVASDSTGDWIKQRLREIGLEDDYLIVRLVHYQYVRSTGNLEKPQLINGKVFAFD